MVEECGAKIGSSTPSALYNAAEYGKREILEYLVKQITYLISDPIKAHILVLASENGNLDILKYLLEGPWKNFNLNTEDEYGYVPLFVALSRTDPSSLDTVAYLITKGASINAEAVWYALSCQDLPILRYLVEKAGTDVTMRFEDDDHQTLLHATMALTKNNSPEDLERILVNACYLVSMNKIDIDAIDSNGNTPLHYIANSPVSQNRNISVALKMTKLLVLSGAKIDIKNNAGETALDRAVKKLERYIGGNAGIVAYLTMVEDFNKVLKNNMTMQAFCKIYLDTPENREANFNNISRLAVNRGSYEMFKQLITTDKVLAAASIIGSDTSVKANQFGQDAWYTLLLRRAIEFRNLQFTLDLLTDKPQFFDLIDETIKSENKQIMSSNIEEFMFRHALRNIDQPFKKKLANFLGQNNALVGTYMELEKNNKYGYLEPDVTPIILGFITNQPLPNKNRGRKKRDRKFDELERSNPKKKK